MKESSETWNNTKASTDNAKIVYQQSPTQKNLNALNEAKNKEAEEYQNYLEALKKVREFKPDLEEKIIEKAETNNEPVKILDTSEKAIDATAAAIQAKLEAAVKSVEETGNKLNTARFLAIQASKNYLLESSNENKDLLWDARKAEAEALFFYTKAVDALEDIKKTN